MWCLGVLVSGPATKVVVGVDGGVAAGERSSLVNTGQIGRGVVDPGARLGMLPLVHSASPVFHHSLVVDPRAAGHFCP